MTESTLTKKQARKFERNDSEFNCVVEVRYDDECGNGHNTFAITGDFYRVGSPRTDRNFEFGGCCHDEVVAAFPELAPFIKWHLTSSDGPLHYISNTLYHARDVDCWGLKKGEKKTEQRSAWHIGDIKWSALAYDEREMQPVLELISKGGAVEIVAVEHENAGKPGEYQYAPNYSLKGLGATEWYKAPFKSLEAAEECLKLCRDLGVNYLTTEHVIRIGEGSEPDLEAARSSAVAPDATLEQLQDEEWLKARLPELMVEFKRDVESLGFTW